VESFFYWYPGQPETPLEERSGLVFLEKGDESKIRQSKTARITVLTPRRWIDQGIFAFADGASTLKRDLPGNKFR
jgi:hypothetical protein